MGKNCRACETIRFVSEDRYAINRGAWFEWKPFYFRSSYTGVEINRTHMQISMRLQGLNTWHSIDVVLNSSSELHPIAKVSISII